MKTFEITLEITLEITIHYMDQLVKDTQRSDNEYYFV